MELLSFELFVNTSNGDEMWVRLKDGTIINFLHGRYVGTKY